MKPPGWRSRLWTGAGGEGFQEGAWGGAGRLCDKGGGCVTMGDTLTSSSVGEASMGRKGLILARPQDTEGSRQPLPLTLGLLLSLQLWTPGCWLEARGCRWGVVIVSYTRVFYPLYGMLVTLAGTLCDSIHG